MPCFVDTGLRSEGNISLIALISFYFYVSCPVAGLQLQLDVGSVEGSRMDAHRRTH